MAHAIIHIGFNKTGSTSIQGWLCENQGFLQRSGYYIPELRRNKRYVGNLHAEFCALVSETTGELCRSFSVRHTLRIRSRKQQARLASACHDDLAAAAKSAADGTMILSNEHLLACLPDKESLQLLQGLLSGHFDKIEILAYIRRQEDWIVSHYSQLAKYGDQRSLENFVADEPVKDFNAVLEAWEAVFGTENVHVRLAPPDLISGNNLIEDFCDFLSIPMIASGSDQHRNATPSAAALSVLRRFGQVESSHINQSYPNPAFRDLRAAIDRVDGRFSRPFLDQDQVNYVRSANAAGNEALRKRHFPTKAQLFEDRAIEHSTNSSAELVDLYAYLLEEAARNRIWKLSIRDRFELFIHKIRSQSISFDGQSADENGMHTNL